MTNSKTYGTAVIFFHYSVENRIVGEEYVESVFSNWKWDG